MLQALLPYVLLHKGLVAGMGAGVIATNRQGATSATARPPPHAEGARPSISTLTGRRAVLERGGGLMLATLLGSSSVGFTPPGLLAGLVEQKQREVEKLYRLPDSREDGPWGLRLRYPASESSYKLGRSIGWRRNSLAVLADLKRASPGSALGVTESVDPQMDVMDAVQKVSVVCGAAL